MPNDGWVLLAANCDCCASSPSPIPLRLEITQAVFETIGQSPDTGYYYSDGNVQITSRVVWSDGTITNAQTSFAYPFVDENSGIYGGCGPYSFTVDGVVYSVPMTSFYDLYGVEWRYSAYVIATPAVYEENFTIGDGTAAVASVDFEAQE